MVNKLKDIPAVEMEEIELARALSSIIKRLETVSPKFPEEAIPIVDMNDPREKQIIHDKIKEIFSILVGSHLMRIDIVSEIFQVLKKIEDGYKITQSFENLG